MNARNSSVKNRSRFFLKTIKCMVATALLLAQTSAIHARPQNGAIWIGPSNGNWWVAPNWEGGVIPNNVAGTTWWVLTHPGPNGNGDTIIINQHTTIDKMAIATGDTVRQPNDIDFTIIGMIDQVGTTGLFGGGGTFSMESTGSLTDFKISGGNVLAGGNSTGNGLWLMSNNNNNRIFGIAATDRLTNGTLYTLRGAGQLGVNFLRLSNLGTIDAVHSNPLTIDLAGADNFNQSILQASGGGRLVLSDTTINNAGGVIQALNASFVDVAGSTISNGTLTTQGSGVVRITGNTSALSNILNTGVIAVNNDVDPLLYGTITNAGQFNMNSTGFLTDLRPDSDVTLTGGGVMNLSNNANNRIYGATATRRLTNASDHTIRGSGQIGANTLLNLTNDGLIQADQTANLTIDLIGTANFNNDLMQAINGATLVIIGTHLDNTNGVILAQDNSFVDLNAATIIAGELTTEGSGVVRIVGNTTALSNILNTGVLAVNNDVDPLLYGTITNPGQFNMNSTGFLTDLRPDSDVTFTGGGVLNLSNNVNNRIFGATVARRLTNAADHVIRGSGQIGVNTLLNLTNQGVIQADQAAALTIDLIGTANSNTNLMQATNGATLTIFDTQLDNTGGTLMAQQGSRIDLNAATIIGGELTSQGTGQVRVVGNTTTLMNLLNTSIVNINNDIDLILQGTITNNGIINSNSTGSLTDLRLNTPEVVLAGTGILNFSLNNNNRVFGINATRRLINEAGHTIRGAVQLGVNASFNMTNRGNLIADTTPGITIDPTNDFTNEGLVHVTGAGTLTANPGAFINANGGTVLIDQGRTLTRTANYSQTGGVTNIHGTLNVTAGGFTQTGGTTHVQSTGALNVTGAAFNLQGGTLKGKGLTASSVINSGGAVAPGHSVGHMILAAPYTQGANGSLDIEIAGLTPFTLYDVLTVQGAASLGGTLNVSFAEGYEPPIGAGFTIMSANSLSGQFAQVTGGLFDVIYRTHTVTLVYNGPTPPCALADLNCDGQTNVDDLLILLAAWGVCEDENPCPADIAPAPKADGIVNVDDLLVLLANWG